MLSSSSFLALLLKIDEDLAAEAKAGRCPICRGRLDASPFPRKPRGLMSSSLPDSYSSRHSFSCGNRSCRKRLTPSSVRFLGRRVYLAAVVVLATALQQGVTPWRASRLRALFGASRRTLARWRTWWAEAFPESRFWKAVRSAFSPVVDTSTAPSSLLARFAGDAAAAVAALLRFCAPLSTTADYVPDRRG